MNLWPRPVRWVPGTGTLLWALAPLVALLFLVLLVGCSDIDPDTAEDNRRLDQCTLLHGQPWCSKQDVGGQANYHKPNFGK